MKAKSLPFFALVLGVMFLSVGPSAAAPPNYDIEDISIDVTCDNLTLYVKGYSQPITHDKIQIEQVTVQRIDCSTGEPIGDETVYDGLGALTVFTVPAVFEQEVTYSWEYLGVDLAECACYDISLHVYMPCNVHRYPNAELDCPCEGCTRTLGYWMTHAGYGPQEMDPTWSAVGGPDAPLFDSGQSWYEAFWTSSSGGNAWYILAHQWMAATLNTYQASAPQEVLDALEDGQDLLDAYDGNGVDDPLIPKKDANGVKNPDRDLAIALAETLDDYNKGEIGPGHCEEVEAEPALAGAMAAGCSSINAAANAKAINLQLLLLVLGAVMLGKRVVRKR